MSSKRKRAPPVKVDDEAKKRLNWNMHEDRRNEVDSEVSTQSSDVVTGNCLPLSGVEPSCSKSVLADIYVVEERDEADIVISEDGLVNSCCFTSVETPGPSSSYTSQMKPSRETDSSTKFVINDSIVLTLITFSDLNETWYSQIGEFNLHAQSPLLLEDRQHLTLQRTGGRLCLCASGFQEDGDFNVEVQSPEQTCLVKGSLGRLELEELDWLQKRRIIQLCVEPGEEYVKVCVKICLLSTEYLFIRW